MTKIRFKTIYSIIAIAITLTIVQTPVAAQGEAPERTLEGVWLVTIMPKSCDTGVPNPAANAPALFTFHRGGTMSVWTQNSTIFTTRSPNHGLWKRTLGWSDYKYKFVHLFYNLTTGSIVGSQEAVGTLVLSESGDEFTTDGSVTGFDINGNPLFMGCSNSVGTRFKLEL